jgi:hypothetical protein
MILRMIHRSLISIVVMAVDAVVVEIVAIVARVVVAVVAVTVIPEVVAVEIATIAEDVATVMTRLEMMMTGSLHTLGTMMMAQSHVAVVEEVRTEIAEIVVTVASAVSVAKDVVDVNVSHESR